MKKALSFILILSLSQSIFAFDVKGQRQTIVITNHPIKKDYIKIEHCLLNKDKTIVEGSCDQIGSKPYYSKESLKDLRVDEYVEASLKTLADIGIVIGMIYGGAALGAAAAGSSVFATGTVIGDIFGGFVLGTGGAVAGGGGGVAITTLTKKLNPVRQFKQAAVLSDDLINDVDIEKEDERIENMVELLNEIL